MIPIEAIRKEWRESGRFRSIYRTPAIEGGGLMLGAGTCLARMVSDADGTETLAIEEDGERLVALLAVAKADFPAEILKAFRRASDAWSRGEHALAGMYLALSGFLELDEQDVYRLYMADGLLTAGLAPRDLLKSLDLSPGAIGIGDHWKDEARVPGGNGRASGEWTSGSDSGDVVEVAAGKKPKSGEYVSGNPDEFFDTLEPKVRALAERLNVDESWILGLAALESGWLDSHNRKLNNPFGVTKKGHDNVDYPSIDRALEVWEEQHGSVVRGAMSADDFLKRLRSAHYNTKKADWISRVSGAIDSVQRRLPGWRSRRGEK